MDPMKHFLRRPANLRLLNAEGLGIRVEANLQGRREDGDGHERLEAVVLHAVRIDLLLVGRPAERTRVVVL